MSTQPAKARLGMAFAVDAEDGEVAKESLGARLWRHCKENPFVPVGTVATCVALTMAAVKMRKGQSQSMNYWLRARVVFQAATVFAMVVGAYAVGETKHQRQARGQDENSTVLAKAAKERAEFDERLRAAEEAQRLEEAASSRSKWFGVFGGAKSWEGDRRARKSAEAQKLSPPTGVSSEPAGVTKVHSPTPQASATAAPASEDKVRTPVADATNSPPGSGLMSWLRGSSGSEKQ